MKTNKFLGFLLLAGVLSSCSKNQNLKQNDATASTKNESVKETLSSGPVTVNSVSNTKIIIPRRGNDGWPLYDYAPYAMSDNGETKIWWLGCGEHGTPDFRDNIYYAKNSTGFGVGSYSTPQIVFRPSDNAAKFDENLVGDPSIIKDGGTYYMYYGAAKTDYANGNTHIGFATSSDGINWSRGNNGSPLINHKSPYSWGDCYGAGQPSVVKDGNYYYMFYTTVERVSNQGALKGGEYAIRSTSPTFNSNVEEFRTGGWANVNFNANNSLIVNRNRPLFGGEHVYDFVRMNGQGKFLGLHRNSDNSVICRVLDLNLNEVSNFQINLTNNVGKEQVSVMSDNTVGQISPLSGTNNKSYNLKLVYSQLDGGPNSAANVDNIFYYDLAVCIARITFP